MSQSGKLPLPVLVTMDIFKKSPEFGGFKQQQFLILFVNLQFGYGLKGTACLCSTQHHLRGLEVWVLESAEGPCSHLGVDAGRHSKGRGQG